MLVVFIHPEQWNGGSDRFAAGLLRYFAKKGHKVIWLTTMIDDHWNKDQFEDGDFELWQTTGLSLHPGDWFSQNVALAFRLCFSSIQPDLIVVDHSASCLPLLKWRFPRTKLLFYCHFPQQLVFPSRFFVYRWFGMIVAIIEELMFRSADLVLTNSDFTRRTFMRVMPGIDEHKLLTVYPPCDVDAIRNGLPTPISRAKKLKNERYTFLSVNRFWPEKRLDVIIDAVAVVKSFGFFPLVQLAGSVMPHIPESSIYRKQLLQMTVDLNVEDLMEFVDSPSDEQKFALFRQCDSVLYTPPNEHFGIVPIEALEQRRPVIVCDNGGPAETVIEDVTGTKMPILNGPTLALAMMNHMKRTSWLALDDDQEFVVQKRRFVRNFSSNGFGSMLDQVLITLFDLEGKKKQGQKEQVTDKEKTENRYSAPLELRTNG